MIHLRKKSEEVFYYKSKNYSFINYKYINFLKSRVSKTKKKRVRICLHKSIKDKLHEMIIVLSKQTYIRPHKHQNKAESLHVIQGSADVVFFSNNGKVVKKERLSKNKNFLYRLSSATFHTFKIRSKFFIFHETTEGPFIKNKTVFAKWSPKEINKKKAKYFIKAL